MSSSSRRGSPEESLSRPASKISVRWGMPPRLRSALDQLDAIAVRVAHEGDHRPLGAAAGAVRRLLRLDPVLLEAAECALEVLQRERDVVVARAQVVGVDPV